MGITNDLLSRFPDIANEWDYEKNGVLTPDNISYGSGTKVWWLCPEKKHSYDASPNNRTNKTKAKGCPYCARQKVCLDNCLATTHPELAKEWHPILNEGLTIYSILSGSPKMVWWLCPEKQHAYKESPKTRSNQKTNCPYCSNYRVNEENCLVSTHPIVANEWHPTRNGNLCPNDIVAGYRKNVWWLCEKKHEYPASPKNRTGVNKTGCPYCSGRKALPETCLAVTHPEIAKEWHSKLNGNLTPNDVLPGRNAKVWWVCPERKHEYQSAPVDRTRKDNPTNCPYCANKKASEDNCLAVLFPDLLKEWDYEKNGSITPYNIVPGREAKTWWLCPAKGHSYRASPYIRTTTDRGCPYCNNREACEDNCLAVTHPDLTKEWHPTKNGKYTPFNVLAGNHKKFWWICSKGHEYPASLLNRARKEKPSRCPYCTNQKVCYDNCLATTHPELAKEWHPTKNGKLTPYDVIAGSNKKRWWICERKHEWEANSNSRAKKDGSGSGCPICIQSKGEKKIEKFLISRNITHQRQYGFEDCRYKRVIPFDFAIFNSKTELIALIEYDGIQHEKPVEAWGGIKKLNEVIRKDHIKNEYCKNRNINLIRIKYSEFSLIEVILIKEFTRLGFTFETKSTCTIT
ncbi:zinc-ribbon domain-containing protein [Brevibacillus sp. NPDC058079]|uniref:zinc-ribbon domain-containing protein n=1 Tax=Brevibacillus sp. NPDC058079 TaxID=3346330 RepID=UPI0036E352BA